MSTVTRFSVAADHPAFEGHFPGHPIVPAVVLVAEAMAAVEASTGKGPQQWALANAKFLQAVMPGSELEIAQQAHDSGSVRFEIRSSEGVVASGQLVPA